MLGNVRQADFKLHGPWDETFGWKLIARDLMSLCSSARTARIASYDGGSRPYASDCRSSSYSSCCEFYSELLYTA
jgi:hypothetical protein